MTLYPDDAVILAPLAGYTDVPYRLSARRHGCIYAFTEMVDVSSLVHSTKRSLKFLKRDDGEKWLGVQLVGRNPDEMIKAVEVVNEHNFDVLDLNMGCPTPKVAKRGKGAGLAKEIDLAVKIIDVMVHKSRFPVTAKIRIQDKTCPESTIYLAKQLESAGIQALTIHGRLYEAIYSGPCHAQIISAVRESLKIQVIANGGVFSKESYDTLRKDTGCTVVMVARGAMGNPWIFNELKGNIDGLIGTDEFIDEMHKHISDVVLYHGEKFGMKFARKIILDYLKGRGYGGELKSRASKISTLNEFEIYLDEIRKGPSESFVKQYAIWRMGRGVHS